MNVWVKIKELNFSMNTHDTILHVVRQESKQHHTRKIRKPILENKTHCVSHWSSNWSKLLGALSNAGNDNRVTILERGAPEGTQRTPRAAQCICTGLHGHHLLPSPPNRANVSSGTALPAAEPHPGPANAQAPSSPNPAPLPVNTVCNQRGEPGVGGVSGCRNRLDILNPGQSDWNLGFAGARGFCNGLGVGLDVCNALFKLLLKEFLLFGVASHEHRGQQAPCHGCAPETEENGPCQLARL